MKQNVTAALAVIAMFGASSVFACDGAPAATDASTTAPVVASKSTAPAKTVKVAHARSWVTCVGNECARPVVAACAGKDCQEPITR
jgi:hypothetical protein